MDKNFYQPIIYQPISDMTLRSVLEERFGREFAGAKNPDCILILASYCYLLSPEELSTFFRFINYHSFQQIFARLQQDGRMVGVTLYHNNKTVTDGRTSVLYALSKNGFKYVMDKYRPELSVSDYKKPSETYACHDYGTSWSILSLISNPFLSSVGGIRSELLFDSNGRPATRPTTDGLRIDGVIKIGSDTVYLEEDKGTERLSVLRDKFRIYGSQGFNLISNGSILVLSIKQPYIALMDPARVHSGKALRYSKKHLEAVIALAKQHPELREKYYMPFTFKSIHEAIQSGHISSSSLTELSEALWLECESMGYADIDDPKATGPFLFSSVEDIEEHLNGILNCTSTVYFYEYAKIQDEFCMNKRNALIENILAGGIYRKSKTDIVAPDIEYYLGGFRFFVGPTCMIDRTYFYAFYEQTPFKSILEETLKLYMPAFDPGSYKPYYVVRDDCPLKKAGSPLNIFLMRNCYMAGNWMVFVENLAYDIAAAVRIKAAALSFSQERRDDCPRVIIVCLVRNYDEAKYFYDLLELSSVPLNAATALRITFIDICSALESLASDKSRVLPHEFNYGVSPLYGIVNGKKRDLTIAKVKK